MNLTSKIYFQSIFYPWISSWRPTPHMQPWIPTNGQSWNDSVSVNICCLLSVNKWAEYQANQQHSERWWNSASEHLNEHSFGFIFYDAESWRNVSCHKKLIWNGFKGNKTNECASSTYARTKEHWKEREEKTQSRQICFKRFWFLLTFILAQNIVMEHSERNSSKLMWEKKSLEGCLE